jgi:hypothetical protein
MSNGASTWVLWKLVKMASGLREKSLGQMKPIIALQTDIIAISVEIELKLL